MGRAIFISYRRDDSEGEAGRLYDDLIRSFGEGCVFMDVAGINPGANFRKVNVDNVTNCGVLLAVLGPRWISATDDSGQRRLGAWRVFRLADGRSRRRSACRLVLPAADDSAPSRRNSVGLY